MWVLGLLVFLPLLTAGLLFFIQGDRLRDAVVKVSAAAIAMLSLFVAFTYFGNKVSSVWEILFWRKVQY